MTRLVDTTIVSNFAAVGRLDLLRSVLGTANIADSVLTELHYGAEQGYAFLSDIDEEVAPGGRRGWLTVVSLEDETERSFYDSLPRRLHPGEAMSLAIARRRGWTLFTDDRAARVRARRWGIRVGGTISLLLEIVEREYLSLNEANALLQDMVARAGYRSPVEDLRKL